MDANNFIASLKANGSNTDITDLDKVYTEYKIILTKTAANNRGHVSLNVLCMLCRNLEKVPSWCGKVNNESLLVLSIECIRQTRNLDNDGLVKSLACIYHLHKHSVKQQNVPPELILKLSYMPFEHDSEKLFKEYNKTYWNIVADRLSFLEKLKARGISINKLLPKVTEDVLKVIHIYETVQFCTKILTFLMKKVYFLFSDHSPKELNEVFRNIFENLSSKEDLHSFKDVSMMDALNLYKIFNDCIYVVSENAMKIHFKDSILDVVVRSCISMIGHRSDMFHCLQTFYLKGFCCIFTNKVSMSFSHNILANFIKSFKITEKLGYEAAMHCTYPFLSQLLRLYIDFSLVNMEKLSEQASVIQMLDICLNLIQYLMKVLRKTDQLSKCDNCMVKCGLHDALRLSFSSKNFMNVFVMKNFDLTSILPLYYGIIAEQHLILMDLKKLGCINYEKCYRKLQTDVHNMAISLNKANFYEYSIKLFDIYLTKELSTKCFELKNISRAFYNKSICESDTKLFKDALTDAFLSLVFGLTEDLDSDKYMNLVLDTKAKALKSKNEDDDEDLEIQMMTVVDACEIALERNCNMKQVFKNLKFSTLLKHEYSIYAKLWPSITPVAGVWRSLHELANGEHGCLVSEDKQTFLRMLYEIILQTPTVVRSIHNDYYKAIITSLLQKLDGADITLELRIIYATLLFLRAEYDIAEANEKYGCKTTEATTDPDRLPEACTVSQEHEALKKAIQAVDMWTDIVKELNSENPSAVEVLSLQTTQLFVPLLLYYQRHAHALQLAHTCCEIAKRVVDKEAYLRNAGIILSNSAMKHEDIIKKSGEFLNEMFTSNLQSAIVFVCDAAIHYIKIGSKVTAAKLIRLAQAKVFAATGNSDDVCLELATARLFEAQTLLCTESGLSTLSAVTSAQRHYLAVRRHGNKWSVRHLISLTLKYYVTNATLGAACACRSMYSWRRARAAAAAARLSAAAGARLHARTSDACRDDTQAKIVQRLKFSLGLESETRMSHQTSEIKLDTFTPRHNHIETMLDCRLKKVNTSPTFSCVTVPAFRTPDCVTHKLCDCYACETPVCVIAAVQTVGLEAAVYYRAQEYDIANNYFDGVLSLFELVNAKLKDTFALYTRKFERFVVDAVRRIYESELKRVQLEILIEAAFFKLSQRNYEDADDFIVRIHEIIQESVDIDPYLKHEILNLTIATARLRKSSKHIEKIDNKDDKIDLELEFDDLCINQTKDTPKTPENKVMPNTGRGKVVVSEEELPSVKRKLPKINLDDDDEAPVIEKPVKKTVFKIPVLITSKPVPETITPRATRSKPNVSMFQPFEDKEYPTTEIKKLSKSLKVERLAYSVEKPSKLATPRVKKSVKSTPDVENISSVAQETSELFFTPTTLVKTYSKKSVRHDIIKNLEKEFSTLTTEDRVNAEVETNKSVIKQTKDKTVVVKETDSRRLRQRSSKNNI